MPDQTYQNQSQSPPGPPPMPSYNQMAMPGLRQDQFAPGMSNMAPRQPLAGQPGAYMQGYSNSDMQAHQPANFPTQESAYNQLFLAMNTPEFLHFFSSQIGMAVQHSLTETLPAAMTKVLPEVLPDAMAAAQPFIILPNGRVLPRPRPQQPPKREDYPNAKFWESTDYDAYVARNKGLTDGNATTSSGPGRPRNDDLVNRHPYVTDTNGNECPQIRMRLIGAGAITRWNTLKECGRDVVPVTWNAASGLIQEWFQGEMYAEFPELALCEGHYKLKKWAIKAFSGWRKKHFLPQVPQDNVDSGKKRKTDTANIKPSSETVPGIPSSSHHDADLDNPSLISVKSDFEGETSVEDAPRPKVSKTAKGKEPERPMKRSKVVDPLRARKGPVPEKGSDSDVTLDGMPGNNNAMDVDDIPQPLATTSTSTPLVAPVKTVLPPRPTAKKRGKTATSASTKPIPSTTESIPSTATVPASTAAATTSNLLVPTPRPAPAVEKPSTSRSTRSSTKSNAAPPGPLEIVAFPTTKVKTTRRKCVSKAIAPPKTNPTPTMPPNDDEFEGAKKAFATNHFYQTGDTTKEGARAAWENLAEEARLLWLERVRTGPGPSISV